MVPVVPLPSDYVSQSIFGVSVGQEYNQTSLQSERCQPVMPGHGSIPA